MPPGYHRRDSSGEGNQEGQSDAPLTEEIAESPPDDGGAERQAETEPAQTTQARAIVEIYGRGCPAGFDASGADLEALNAACQESMNGERFSLTMNGSGQEPEAGARFEQRIGERAPNGIRFLEILPGPIEVRGTIPPGYGAPIVYCRWTALGQISRIDLSASGDGFNTDVAPNTLMSCAWINIPAGGVDAGDTGNVYINKYRCPVGFDAYSANLGQLASNCGETMNGIVFVLAGTRPGEWITQATGSQSPSGISWTGVPAGQITITEDVPTGYGEPIVYCQDAPEAQDGVLTPVEFNPSVEVVHQLRAGYDFHCDWFNVPPNPGGENGTISINKHVCPAGFDAENANLSQLAVACQDEPRDGYLFTMLRDGTRQTEQRTGDQAPGAVLFGLGEAPAQFAVKEDIPAGFGTPIVYCGQTFANGGASRAQQVEVNAANAISFILNAGDQVFCDWFNIRQTGDEGRSKFHIFTYACPAGFDAAQAASFDDRDMLDACPEEMDGIAFQLRHGGRGETLTQTAGDIYGGAVYWGSVMPGSLEIQGAPPPGHGEPIVFCVSGGKLTRFDVRDGRFIFDLPPDTYLGCDWFDIPLSDDADPGDAADERVSIRIDKHACPASTAPDADLARLLDECRQTMDGVRFSLDRASSDVVLLQRTGELVPSAVVWRRLDPDHVTIAETVPEGYGEPVVFCTVRLADKSDGPAQAPVEARGQIVWTLEAGEFLFCDWFNLPLRDDAEFRDEPQGLATVRIVTYWCEGQEYSSRACDLDTRGIDFALSPADSAGESIPFETDSSGEAEMAVAPGVWNLESAGDRWCRAASPDADGNGNLIVRSGQSSVVTVFNCDSPRALVSKHQPDSPPRA